MYHMARGSDENTRLVNEAATSSSAPNLSAEPDPTVEIRPTTYGSIDSTVSIGSTNSETEPLIHNSTDPNV